MKRLAALVAVAWAAWALTMRVVRVEREQNRAAIRQLADLVRDLS